MRNIKSKLKKLFNSTTCELEQVVIQECLDAENPEEFIQDVLHWGCKSGIVSSLIYYSDTHKFFDQYYQDIENLRTECDIDPLTYNTGDLKNFLAWFGFEETLYRIATKLGIE